MGACADYVNGGVCEAEGINLNDYLTAQGHSVTTFTGNVPTSLVGIDVLYYPEFEGCDLSTSLTSGDISTITDYINAGGGIVIHGDNAGGNYANFINSVFSLGVVATNVGSNNYTLNNAQTSGTRFENCAPSIPDLNATDLLVNSMPTNKVCIYEDGNATAVATIPFGRGEIRFIGWDYFNGGPGCPLENADWNALIDKMIIPFNKEEENSPIPTLSEWGLMIFGLLTLNLGLITLRRKEELLA